MHSDTKIITFGGGSQDVFIEGKALRAKRDVREHDYVETFPLGAKIDIEKTTFDIGGGATNAAVTFARQGFNIGYVGKIGRDPAGSELLRVLQRENVDTERVVYDKKLGTQYSVIMLSPTGERTILVYRGASHSLTQKDVAIRTLEADWFYITTLDGNFPFLTKLLNHAVAHGIKVALDPGAKELEQPKKLKALLPMVTVLKANAEELATLFGGDNLKDTVTIAAGNCEYVVGTDGPHGSYAVYDNTLYRAGTYQKVKVIDRTGAGDAFGSGFVAALAQGKILEDALTLGSANATSVVTKVGAKAGILRTGRLARMRIEISDL